MKLNLRLEENSSGRLVEEDGRAGQENRKGGKSIGGIMRNLVFALLKLVKN